MAVAIQTMRLKNGIASEEEKMKRRFYNWALSGILLGIFCTGAMAQSGSDSTDKKQKKEKVQIIVVKKEERKKPDDSGKTKKPRSESHAQSSNQ